MSIFSDEGGGNDGGTGEADPVGHTYIAYDFDIFPLDADFHPIAALHVVTRRTGRGGPAEHQVLYVGEAAKLQEHFVDHPKTDCFTRHKADCVGVHRQEEASCRREAVADLEAQLKPPCNA